MTVPIPDDNSQKEYDQIIIDIVDYVYTQPITSSSAFHRAKLALLDALGAAIESLHTSPECLDLVTPIWPSAGTSPHGFPLPGTSFTLDPLNASFALGSMIRYLDHNDAFPGAEWGHPSDNLGAILTLSDTLSRCALLTSPEQPNPKIPMRTVLEAMIKAYEIQGVFQIKNAFNKRGLDHTILVKIASTAVCSWLSDLPREKALAAVSHAWADGHPLRIFRQAPNTGPRKGWAAGDACQRALHLVSISGRKGQPGIRTALTERKWGFYDVFMGGEGGEFRFPEEKKENKFGSWVAENVFFKLYTAEGHGITALEATLGVLGKLKKEIGGGKEEDFDPIRDVEVINVRTQRAAMAIINKDGSNPLANAADRDHCMRYMIAVTLLKGAAPETADYQDGSPWAEDERVEVLRGRIRMEEEEQFTRDYHDPKVRSVTSEVEVVLRGRRGEEGVVKERVDFPLGHPKRNKETEPMVREKAIKNLELMLPKERVEKIVDTVESEWFGYHSVSSFMDLFRL